MEFGSNPIRPKLKKGFAEFLQEAAKGGIDGTFDLEVIQIPHPNQSQPGKYQFAPKYTFGGYGDGWHDCPFDSEDEALRFLAALKTCSPRFVKVPDSWGEGKARNLSAARSCAVWPDATDEDLCAPDLRERLMERLPGLLRDMREDFEMAGIVWAPERKIV